MFSFLENSSSFFSKSHASIDFLFWHGNRDKQPKHISYAGGLSNKDFFGG